MSCSRWVCIVRCFSIMDMHDMQRGSCAQIIQIRNLRTLPRAREQGRADLGNVQNASECHKLNLSQLLVISWLNICRKYHVAIGVDTASLCHHPQALQPLQRSRAAFWVCWSCPRVRLPWRNWRRRHRRRGAKGRMIEVC